MSAEPSTESAAAAAGAVRADGSVQAAPPPRTEREVNSPSPLTLSFLGVVFLATFFPWLAAKVACNGREAPVRQPPELSLDILSRQPKDAALELQQRAASGRYREAAELARGDAEKELLEADARCQKEPQPCEALRARADDVTTRAVLVGRGPLLAQARVESQVGGESERHVLELKAEGNRWYVTSRKPYSGDLHAPVPVIHLTPTPGTAPGVPSAPGAPPSGAPAQPSSGAAPQRSSGLAAPQRSSGLAAPQR